LRAVLGRLTVLLLALSLATPSVGLAQEDAPPLSNDPPVSLGGDGGEPGGDQEDPAPTSPAAEPELAATGSETWLIGALGAGMLFAGIGLRLRVAPGA
jgi:hypothetical protein